MRVNEMYNGSNLAPVSLSFVKLRGRQAGDPGKAQARPITVETLPLPHSDWEVIIHQQKATVPSTHIVDNEWVHLMLLPRSA